MWSVSREGGAGVNLISRGKMRTSSATQQKMIILFPTTLAISGYRDGDTERGLYFILYVYVSQREMYQDTLHMS